MDRIIKKDSTEMHVIVTSIEGDDINYRVYGSKSKDSIYSIPKSAVLKVIFRNKQAHYFPKPTKYYANGTVKPDKFFPIYVDLAAGFTIGFKGLADVSIGYRFNEKEAIGISRIVMSDYTIDASGIGVQCRLTPLRKSLFKLELGVITSASSIDRSGPQIYTHLRKKSSDVYVRIGAAVRFSSIFTFGINFTRTGALTFDVSQNINRQNVALNQTWSRKMGFLCPQLGITLPSMLKKRKG